MPQTPGRLGIISAMQEEQAGLVQAMQNPTRINRGQRDYISGQLWGRDVVCVLSRMGKVAAAATTATLIERFGVTQILFTGVAGATAGQVKIGDLVIGDELIQHDMDSRPLFPQWEVPLTGQARFASNPGMSQCLQTACQDFLREDFPQTLSASDREAFKLQSPRVHRGLIASGDEFIHGAERANQLNAALPGLLAVEMEGAAVAQVCFEFGLPFAVVRTISDEANADSPVDFLRFVERIASTYAVQVVRRFCLAG